MKLVYSFLKTFEFKQKIYVKKREFSNKKMTLCDLS